MTYVLTQTNKAPMFQPFHAHARTSRDRLTRRFVAVNFKMARTQQKLRLMVNFSAQDN